MRWGRRGKNEGGVEVAAGAQVEVEVARETEDGGEAEAPAWKEVREKHRRDDSILCILCNCHFVQLS